MKVDYESAIDGFVNKINEQQETIKQLKKEIQRLEEIIKNETH